ncbi:M15 family metallopeptidase [Priestia koreensis]|uniref:M15 family metallopeptidase n=1 Tax=Priestia koreensis TaxID=284581 RepID=UPI003C6E19E9
MIKKPLPIVIAVLVFSFIFIVGFSHSIHETPKKMALNDNKKEHVQPSTEIKEKLPIIISPDNIDVLVNKEYGLPEDYAPNDLVYPNIPFLFNEKIEKRMMRKEPAEALEKMFAAAKLDGICLAGVSGYRSVARQEVLYNAYVHRDGVEAADTYSARPGHSEHHTGLAIDVSGITGEFAVEDHFADTKEAAWLDKHAHEYGFIIRFPKGKEEITGYKYEPWHIRYVGTEVATEIFNTNSTLEEYYRNYFA